MSQREDTLKFETGRIKALQEERLHIQKKTFTKWMNSFLAKARMEVDDLFVDLADGRKLLKLLEIISGEKLGKPNNGKMRVHKIENVNKSLAFLHTKVRLESIGAEDIVDGNPRLILGLIWTIILRFQIQEIEIDVDEENESSEKKSAKDALLLWCQRKTAGYHGVNIQDFTGSWRNGLGFNALIHSHRPDLIDYESLVPSHHVENLNNAFDIAQRELAIAKLLDAEDVDTNKPDEKSVITYVASYYHTFAKMKNEMKGGRRIANIVGQMMDTDRQKANYETFSTDLLNWIHAKIKSLEDRNFPNSLDGIQGELMKFKMYRTEEKPLKYKEKSEIEALLFSIQTKLKALGQPLFMPPEGILVHDIERAWEELEKAEHSREVALRDELLRQERLEQLAYKFERKSILREGYLQEMIQVLSDPRYGSNLTQVEATVKKHEAISADILARKERFHDLNNMAVELVKENYHGKDSVVAKKEKIMEKWKSLLELLDKHKQILTTHNNLMSMLRDIDTMSSQIETMEETFSSEDYGKHLLAVEDLLQKHSLLESQVVIQGETIKRMSQQAEHFISGDHKESPVLKKELQKLKAQYNNLIQLRDKRREKLEESRVFLQFIQDYEEEEAWVIEKQRVCQTVMAGKDLRAVLSFQRKHKALEDEIKVRWPKSEQLCKIGELLIQQHHPESVVIKVKISNLKSRWKELHELAAVRKKQLDESEEACQYYTDANEADSWMNEKITLVKSIDYGDDEPTAQSLLQRHGHLESEIKSYEGDIHRLNEQADKLISSGISSLNLIDQFPVTVQNEPDEYIEEIIYVPEEVEVEQIVEKEVMKEVIEEKLIPQVKASYSFHGQGMDMNKGEVMILLNKTNNDWWNVRKANGHDGFIPANYVKEIDPKIVKRVLKRPVKVPEVQRIKKIVKKPKTVRRKKEKSPQHSSRRNLPLSPNNQHSDNDAVEKRQAGLNQSYLTLLNLTKARRSFLEDAIELFGFYRECDDFEMWMRDKEKMLTNNDEKESVENLKRKFENFLTDLSASNCRIEAIDKKVKNFTENGHSKLDKIKQRQRQIHDRWNNLNKLKNLTEKNLEGATSVELFNRTCDEANDWMLEKLDKMDTDELGKDLKTIQALQRKHQNLERELAPVEDKFNRVNLLAQSVKSSYPNERANVTGRQKDLHELWDRVKAKAAERRSRLEEAVGQQIFNNTAKNLLSWIGDVKNVLNNNEAARDVATAEALLKKHNDIKDEINAHQDEFEELYNLGEAIMASNPDAKDVKAKFQQLQTEEMLLHKAWEEKDKRLKECIDFQVFNREADNIDAITSNQEKYLENGDLGSSLDDLEALMKRHEDFENTFLAQDERVKSFSSMADKLIASHHYESPYINERRNQVLDRRQNVRDKAQERKAILQESQQYHKFKADSEELTSWIEEKLKTASDDSYKDLNNLERKLKKHEAFEGELKANEGRLRNVNRVSQQLIADDHFKAPEVKHNVEDVIKQWKNLGLRAEDKGKNLRQAVALQNYYKHLEDVKGKLADIEIALQSDDLGNDLRSVKHLLKKHQAIENDMNMWDSKIQELINSGDDMIKEGHFDSANIQKQMQSLKRKHTSLKEPIFVRRQQLEESLKLHQFHFEVDIEMQWIKEHLPIVYSTDIGQNLVEAQNLVKKHKKFEIEINGHQQVIEKTLAKGQSLINENHYASDSIKDKCSELENAWKNLCSLAQERKKKLELSLKAQLFFSEANEIEGWMNEKNDVLNSQDFGRDEDAAVKLLTKHKTLELELDSYNGLINEMGHRAQQMIDAKHPDSKVIQNKQQIIAQQIKSLLKLANVRRQKLMESKHVHEYFRESNELEQWFNEQLQVASSDEFGQDYEHLLILLNKFDDFKHRVEASTDQFVQCEELAKKLIASDSPYTSEIEKRQEQLQSSWNSLLEQIETREQKLQAAGEIHRFNRDVCEALQRIQEKHSSISDDLGRDLNSVQGLIRRHEGFENDLVALEAQLQVLIDDSAQLQVAYPGGNAEHILMQQNIVVDQWTALQEHAELRKKKLQESCDLQRFLASVRDLVSWGNSLQASIMTEETVRDATSAQILKNEHERLKAEIEAREESFSAVVHTGEFLVENNHYAKSEIEDKIKLLLDTRQKLHAAWQHKKVYLDQLIDLQFFLRDAKQLETIASTQEAHLSGGELGTTVEEVTVQLKKHDAFEKLMQSQDEKLSTLQNHCSKLIQQNHFDAQNIRRRMNDVIARRARIKDLSNNQKQKLSNTLLYTQFRRDVAEADAWIEDKRKKLEMEKQAGDTLSLEEKIKRLQKHQAFEAELAAREVSIKEIKKKGEILLNKHYEATPSVRQQLDNLLSQWNQLLFDSNNRSRGLEEAQDILQFTNRVEKVEAWIRDKEMMIQVGDMGKDYEHCLAIQRRLEDVDSDMQVDESRIKKIGAIADRIIRQGRSDTRAVQQRKEEVYHKWKALQGALQEYREHLAGALEIHAFNRDVDDTNDRINEKAVIMSAEDYGKDLSAVEALQRKQEAVERDMTAIEGKLREHDGEARRLILKYPDMSIPIRSKLSDVQDNWRSLNNICHTRKQLLASSFTLQKFLAEMKELETWVNEMISRMTSSQIANSITEAESLLQLHQERKAEIDGRQDSFKGLKEFGHRLIQQNHYAKEDLEKHLARLEEQRRTLLQVWEEQKQVLKQSLDYQLFNEQADQADNWLNNKEAFLNNEDLGDSLASVETLMRKHEGFEKTLEAQESKIDQLEKFATELLARKHNDSARIQDRLQAICQRRDRLKENTVVRRHKLQESKQLQQFLRNNYEVLCWISEKLKVACDENYRDPTNLQRKIQKHLAFEAELGANKGRINAVNQEGEKLLGAGHFAAMEIQAELDELEKRWQNLQDESQLKKERLNDAYQAMLLNQSLEDLDSWMDDVEAQLQSEDHGKDLANVQHLLKKHQNLESEINNHADNIEQMKNNATAFINSNHFMSDEIQERVQSIVKRYSSLHEPVQIRRDNLEEALLLYQFYRDIDDELMWISEKEPLVSSTDLGLNLTSVQNLQKKHQAVEAEIKSHEPVITSVASMAQQMIRSNHFASGNIESKIQDLNRRMQHLKDQASVRRLRLLDAVESQMFYSEVSEAEVWMKEKLPLLNNPDVGKDEDSVQVLIKKLDRIERDIQNFNAVVVKLHQLHQRLVERGHFDSENIKQKQEDIEEKFQVLQNLVEKRRAILDSSKQLFKYLREADELIEWIEEQMVVANVEEYGRDLEHVEILINKFEGFLNNLHTNEDRVKNICNSGSALVKENHPNTGVIQQKINEVVQIWEDLKEHARSRQEALSGAKLVHLFDRNADETISWIHEKDAILTSEDYGHDLESIQSLVRKHEGFERDLAAVKEQVENVVTEARRLAGLFPDARDHISIRHEETVEVWNCLLDKSAQRKDKLHQAEQLQAYFDEYRELMAWINEMMAKITAPELAQDVSGAEALLTRHLEHFAEIDSRKDAIAQFNNTGQRLISQGHFMGDEIQEKINRLNSSHNTLLSTWKQRQELYQQNLDVQRFKRDAENLEMWLDAREPVLHDEQYGDSILNVEELIRKHEDFEKTIEAQEDKFMALKRITMLEEAFQNQKKLETEQRKAEETKREQERVDAIKRREQQRILDERRREGERRRTTEIKFFNKDNDLVVPVNVNGDVKSISASTEKLARYPSSDSISSSPGLHARKMSAVEIPDIKPSEDLMKIGSSKTSLDAPEKGNLRRGESMRLDMNAKKAELPSSSIKRSESMKLDEQQKKLKKTPSFTTRRRTHSFRKNKRGQENISNLPPVEIEGYLERKQELQSGGKRAAIRSWKTYYTVLCGQLLCFFRDKDDFIENKAAAPPVTIHQAKCSKALDYTKKKYVFRIQITDGAEYLFLAELYDTMMEWINKINFHATLPPRMQLLRYDACKDGETVYSPNDSSDYIPSAQNATHSSQNAIPDSKQPALPEHTRGIFHSTNPFNEDNSRTEDQTDSPQPIYVNFPFNPEPVQVKDVVKPPVPVRSVSLDAYKDSTSPEDGLVKSRIQMFQNSVKNKSNNYATENENGFNSGKKSGKSSNAYDTSSEEPIWISRTLEKDRHAGVDDEPPPLPITLPPHIPTFHPHNQVDDGDWHDDPDYYSYGMPRSELDFTEENDFIRKSQDSSSNVVGRHHSLPPFSVPPENEGFIQSNSATMDTRLRMSMNDSMPENELHSDRRGKERKRVFRLFKRN